MKLTRGILLLRAPQDRSEEIPKKRNHDIRPGAELVSEPVNKSNRPTQALEFVSMLRHQRANADAVPLGDELIVGSSKNKAWTGYLRDRISLGPIPKAPVIRQVVLITTSSGPGFSDRQCLLVLSAQGRPTTTSKCC